LCECLCEKEREVDAFYSPFLNPIRICKIVWVTYHECVSEWKSNYFARTVYVKVIWGGKQPISFERKHNNSVPLNKMR